MPHSKAVPLAKKHDLLRKKYAGLYRQHQKALAELRELRENLFRLVEHKIPDLTPEERDSDHWSGMPLDAVLAEVTVAPKSPRNGRPKA